jgi:LuxR family maltose regulon positive regulatory protein
VNDVLLQTKLSIPVLRTPSLVARARLIEKLNSGLAGKLTLVSAPAGYGKTTLLAAWADKEAGAAVCWLSLDDVDDDLARFLNYLIAAIRSLGDLWEMDHLDQDVVAHYVNARPPDVETLLMILINEIAAVPDHFVLVLDDYQAISLLAIHRALTFLLDHMPPNMHLVLCTRVDPPLPLPRLRGRGLVSEIRQRDLKFSEGESALFLEQVAGFKLTAEESAALSARTEGWAAGLQMAAVSLGGSDDREAFIRALTGSHRHILDYLLEEVLRSQSPEIQTFLLQTSLLDRLVAPLCDAVMENSASQSILEQLERSNLFILPLDDERGWYRYHHLFADLLRHRLRITHAEQIPELHARATLWFERNGFVVEAIDHALAARDFDRAARLLEDHAGQSLMRGEIALLLRWLDAVPDDLIVAWPSLCIYHAWARLLTGRPLAEVEARLLEAEKAGISGEISAVALVFRALMAIMAGDTRHSLELSGHALEMLPADSRNWRSYVLSNQGMAYVLSGDAGAAIAAFEESVRIGQEAGNKMAVIGGLSNLAGLTMARGQLHKSAASYRRALDLASDAQGKWLPVAHRVLLGLGELAREWNDLDAAERYFTESLKLSRRYGEMGPMSIMGLMSLLHLARVKGEHGEFEKAGQLLEEARQLALKSQATPLDDLLVEATQMRLWLQQGDLAAAERWVRERELDQPSAAEKPGEKERRPAKPYEIHEIEQLMLARVALARGLPDKALAILEPLEQRAEQRDQQRRLVEILVFKALALQARGNAAEALDTIRQALNLAEPEGYVRTFVDAGEAMAELLSMALSKGIAPDYAIFHYSGRLLAAFSEDEHKGEAERSASSTQALVERLSQRELEVLQLIAEGLSNREIAARLVISLSTVKGHTANIYGKLGVHRRTLAVARARELGLLVPPGDADHAKDGQDK